MRRMKALIGAILIALLLVICVSVAYATAFEDDLDAIDRAAKSVLTLMVYDTNGEYLGSGSGFVVFDNYTLVTNYHVMKDSAEIYATSDLGNQYLITKVVTADAQKDIAVLEFFSPTDLQPLALEENNLPRRGEHVVTIGSPHGITNSVTMGNISAAFSDDYGTVITFSAPVSPGSSGGALFNNQGNVIGITTAARNDSQNINFAVDIRDVIKLYGESKNAKRESLKDYVHPVQATAVTVPTATVTQGPQSTPKPTPRPTPAMTREIEAVSVQGNIQVTWESVEGAKEYNIYRSSSMADYVLIGTSTEAAYIDKDVEPGPYYYKVQSVDDEVSSNYSLASKFILHGYNETSKQGVPRNVKVEFKGDNITVSWKDIKNADSYFVYRAVYFDGNYVYLGKVSDNNFVEKKLSSGIDKYFYKVRSVAGFDISRLSTAGKAPKPTPTPKPSKTPKPTSTPYVEPTYPIIVGDDGYFENHKGYPRLNPKIVNISKYKTVDGFTLAMFCEDVYEDRIKQKKSGSEILYFTFSKKIKPKKSVYPGYGWMEGFAGAKYVGVAIVKIHTTDGTIYEIPKAEWDFSYWKLE